MSAPTGCSRIIQIHPTRRCNLRCLHCYSSSGPKERDELDAALLCAAIDDAAREGFTVASFSGGEPLMYEDLRTLLERAHDCGMLTTVTTNGTLLDRRRMATLRGAADLLAISLDGVPESHNEIRASPRAFDRMRSRLEAVRAAEIPFGFIFTLTQYNVNELQWVAEFAIEQGARLLQVHPLDNVGRAREEMPGEGPDEIESAFAFMEVARLQEELGERIYVHLDLIDREYLREHPERVFADEPAADSASLPFSEIVSPLVIEPDGMVVPIQHGFAREFALGSLHAAPLSELMASWRASRLGPFRELCRRVFRETTTPSELPFFNWYETLTRTAVGT
ncbi:MAG TPA: radical SAM protein [Pyrinomonadaceae bacterium]|nr:radical SAM protein [Pyrinomonadaceae bacterium]